MTLHLIARIKAVKHWLKRHTRQNGVQPSSFIISPPVNLKGRFCQNPFQQYDLDTQGNVYVCCSRWLPTPIGNMFDDTMLNIWNSDTAQMIRKSIIDGNFQYCDHSICPAIQNNSLQTRDKASNKVKFKDIINSGRVIIDQPSFVNLCNDYSCNLTCPSCRTNKINHTSGYQYTRIQKLQKMLEQQLFSLPQKKPLVINVTGSGDPFASKVYRRFLYALDHNNFPNLTLNLQTNGVLFTPRNWQRLHKIHNNIGTVLISIDAACEYTYNMTRPGGNWGQLMKNLAFLMLKRRAGKINFIRLDFVVQKDNYLEIPAFVELAKKFGVDQVCFSMILDWGVMHITTFNEKCIWKESHPDHPVFLKVLASPVLDHSIVDLGNLSHYREPKHETEIKKEI